MGPIRAQLMYQSLADTACNRITAAITSRQGERSVKALLDSFNPVGSTRNVNFTTSRSGLWTTDARKCHVNLLVMDSDWEAEFCRVVEFAPVGDGLREEPQPGPGGAVLVRLHAQALLP